MITNNQTITGSVNYGAPIITPMDRLIASTFNGYRKDGFSKEDQTRLHGLFLRLTERGVYCMLSNNDTGFIRSLYNDYNIELVSAKRMINRDGNGRKDEELIITNY